MIILLIQIFSSGFRLLGGRIITRCRTENTAILLIKLSFDVVRLRMQYRIATGDGGSYELQTAIRVHGNAVEYLPIGCLLLLYMK